MKIEVKSAIMKNLKIEANQPIKDQGPPQQGKR